MKKCSFILVSCLASAGLFAQTAVPLYLNIGSHNEVSDSSVAGLAYISDVNDYTAIKSIMLEMSDTIANHGARWNCQHDQNFIRACLKHDTAATSTNDLLQYLDALPHVEVDPHNHFLNTVSPFNPNYNDYNYSDVAHLLDSCGLPFPRTNMGGFIWRDFPSQGVYEEWTQYNTAQQPGYKFPAYLWRPVVAWGGGSPGHTDDYKSYGIWKPDLPTVSAFGQHEQNNYLTVIGQGCDTGFLLTDTSTVAFMLSRLQSLMYFIQQQPADPNAFWTATIMMNHKHYQSANYVSKLAQLLAALDPYVQNGQIAWATLTEKYNTWHNIHSNPGDNFNYLCDNIPLAVEEVTANTIRTYPNPADSRVNFDLPENSTGSLYLYDNLGRLILLKQVENEKTVQLDIQNLEPGIFLAVYKDENGNQMTSRFVRTQL
ncbi:MAG: hypothetical protein FD123_3179 [Bacteroidetes bacterium]|nr:MAG: hypothetical protein FD123_3179 [Bacteroidota bacterium]